MPIAPISNQEREGITKLRQRMDTLGLIPSWKLDNDQFMVRYYRAGGCNLDKAEKMLKFYAEYCKDVNAESLYTEKFPLDFKDQYFAYVGGHDRDGRPMIAITQCGLWNIRQACESGREDMFVRFVLQMGLKFEQEVIRRNGDWGYLVADVKNVAYGNFLHKRTLEVIINLVNKLEKLSPLVIRKVYLVNAPRILVTFFNTVRALVKVSADIYAMDSNEKKWKAALMEHFDADGLCPEYGGTCTDFELI